MKVVQINSVCGIGSTGKICVAVSELLTAKGIENYILYAVGNSTYPLGKKYMSSAEIKLQALKSKIFGNYGFQSKSATKRLIKQLDHISPDIVHLHNLHSHNVHLEVLFSYLKEKKIKFFWTFHDCWAFTGYCTYFDMVDCEKWKTNGCENCPQRNRSSWFVDRSEYLYKKKKELFTGLDMTIITPSKWLASQGRQSFLKEYEFKVINNGIDLSVFCPRESSFRTKYGLENKFIILGVAFNWDARKGLDVFVELSKRLDNMFQIVLVGTDDAIDKKLPNNIITIHRTQNQAELAEIYTVADLFVNPTREEVLGLVNIESLACGTPVLTFQSGGSPECIDESCGAVVPKDDVDKMIECILKIYKTKPFSKEACIRRANMFDMRRKFNEYVELYCNNIL